MIVIDASILTKFILKEVGWEKVLPYLRDGTVSVDLVVKETVNAIWRRCEQGKISIKEAKIMLTALKEVAGKAVKIDDEKRYLDEAIRIAFRRKLTIYDSLYIALAKEKKLKLLTADLTQAKAAEVEGVPITIIQ